MGAERAPATAGAAAMWGAGPWASELEQLAAVGEHPVALALAAVTVVVAATRWVRHPLRRRGPAATPTPPDAVLPASPSARPSTLRLSVVIPCHDTAALLAEQLDALTRQRWEGGWEVVVADNGSTDDPGAVVRRFADRLPGLRMVDASGRRGAAHARNVAARHATGDALVYCDADDVVGDGWLEAMGRALARHDFIACRLEYGRLNDLAQLRARGLVQPDGLYDMYGAHLPFSGAGTLGVLRGLHEAVGGFDEDLDGGGEDTDYCWRLLAAGARLTYVPDAVLHYRYRAGTRQVLRQALTYGRFQVELYLRHGDRMATPPHQWSAGARAWGRVLRSLPAPWDRRAVDGWAWRFGWQLGLLEGSLRRGVVFLCSHTATSKLGAPRPATATSPAPAAVGPLRARVPVTA